MTINRLRHLRSPGIRVQLTLWYTAVFATLILLFSIILYTTIQSSLASGVDAALQLRTQQIAAGVSYEGGKISILDVTGELPGLINTPTIEDPSRTNPAAVPANVNLGILVRILNARSQVVYVSPAFRSLNVSSSSIVQPLHGIPWQGTIIADHGQAVRLYSIALADSGTIFGVVQVGQSLKQLTTTLQSISFALLITTPFLLLLSALVSYWLAKRAFKPIYRLNRTAQDIKAGDLHRRVPVPHTRDEVQALAITLNDMIERLDLAFTQQRRFVADASHELRTPVTVIRSITEIALAQQLSLKEHIAILHDVHTEIERLGQLINDLLVLARADEGQTKLDNELVQLDLLTLDVAASIEPLAVERGLTVHLDKLEPTVVQGDTARLILVMMSLVDNAITYTNAGGTVTLNVEANNDYTCFSVSDTGIGIAPEDLPHIFERFYRADPARSRAAGGSGLGLAIVDWVVRAHGGSITVESIVGQGSTFKVKFPRAASASEQTHRLNDGSPNESWSTSLLPEVRSSRISRSTS